MSTFEEVFNAISGEEIHPSNKLVSYKKIQLNFSSESLMARMEKKLKLYNFFRFRKVEGATIIIFLPSDLLFLPYKTVSSNKIILVQTNSFSHILNFLGRLGLMLKSKYIDYITVYTNKDREKVAELMPNLVNRVTIIPRGCRLETSKHAKKMGSLRLVTVCRLHEKQKNIREMCKIVAMLPKNYSLHIYGSGCDKEERALMDIIKKYSNVEFEGVAKDLCEVLRNYDVFLMTSNYEGFGQTLIEARSQGMPIVAYDTFDAAASIVNGKNGFLVSKGNQQEFADAVLNITKSDGDYAKFSHMSIASASQTEMGYIAKLWEKVL